MIKQGALRTRPSGQSMVETALVLPFLLLLIFGVFEFGRLVFIFSAVNNASREATRYGAATGTTLGGVPRYLNCSAIRQAAIDTAFLAGLTDADIVIHYDEPDGADMQVYGRCIGNSAIEDSSGNLMDSGDVTLGDRVVVTVTRAIDPILPLFPTFRPTFVTARTILKDIAIGPPECDDGVDNDGDGTTDYPADNGCTSADDTIEALCYRLSVVALPEDGGTMSLNPGTNCSNRYVEETIVNLEAFADIRNDPTLRPDYTFNFWQGPVDTGDGSTVNPTTVTMDADKHITAHFRRVQADLSILKTASPEPVSSGSPLQYAIEIVNGGIDTAHDIVMTDTVPAEVTYVGWSSTDGTCDDVTSFPKIVCTVAELPVGENAIFHIDVIAPVFDNTSDTIENTATVTALEFDPTLPNTSTYIATVLPRAELSIAKEASANPVQAAAFFDYTITVLNDGPSLATNVVVSDFLDPDLRLTTGSLPPECSFNTTTREISCQKSEIPDDSTWVITFQVQAPNNGGITIDNTATVDSDEVEDDESDNEDTVSVYIESHANLNINKSAPATASRDVAFDYTIVVNNVGPSDAAGVRIVDTLPAGVVVNSTGSCTPNGNEVTCNVGALAAGELRQFVINVTPTISEGTLNNTATVTSTLTPDPSTGNNTDSTTTTVSTSVGLTIDKTASQSSVEEGEAFSYSITVGNNGPSNATNVQLVDALPDEVDFVSADGGTWDCDYDATDHEVTCAPADGLLVAGQGTTVVISVVAAGTGTIANLATLSSNEDTVSDSAEVSADATLDLSVSLTGPVTGTVDIPYNYTLEIANSGPSDATGVSVGIPLDPDVAFTNTTVPAGWVCSYNSSIHLVDCDAIGPFAAGSVSITITVTPQLAGVVTIQATVTANEISADSNPNNNSDAHTATFEL